MGETKNVFDDGPRNDYGTRYKKLRDSMNGGWKETIKKDGNSDLGYEYKDYPMAFNIHAGNVKGPLASCDELSYERFETLINSLNSPGFLALGDSKEMKEKMNFLLFHHCYVWNNFAHSFFPTFSLVNVPHIFLDDWLDCHTPEMGNYDPFKQLAYVRTRFYNGQSPIFGSGGKGIYTEIYNSKYPELQMWIHNDVMYMTLHIVGSNNGFYDNKDQKCETSLDLIDRDCERSIADHQAQIKASVEFMVKCFDFAKQYSLAGVMVTIHANIFRTDAELSPSGRFTPTSLLVLTGYPAFWDALVAEAKYFQKPVVLFHGGSHFYRNVQNPGGHAKNLAAVMCPGNMDFGWVLCEVDPNTREVFKFTNIAISSNRRLEELE